MVTAAAHLNVLSALNIPLAEIMILTAKTHLLKQIFSIFVLSTSMLCGIAQSVHMESPTGVSTRSEGLVASRFVTSSDGTLIAVQESGPREGRPIVFVHGFSHSSAVWSQQVSSPELGRYHILTMDLRGHGFSGKPIAPSAYSDAGLAADDVNAVIQQLRLDRPVLVGWSLGGIVVPEYLQKYGDSAISGIDLVDSIACPTNACQQTVLSGVPISAFEELASNDEPTELSGIAGFVNLEASASQSSSGRLTPEQLLVLDDIMLTTPAFVRANYLEGIGAVIPVIPDVLKSLTVPVLIQHGRNDPIFPAALISDEVKLIKDPTVKLYADTAHIVFFLEPRQFNHDLAQWLETTFRQAAGQ